MATHRISPAMPSGTKLETYDSASPEVRALIGQLNRLAAATTLDETNAALATFDEDATLDTPFVQLQGRDRIRALTTLAKTFLGTFQMEPRLVKISVPEGAATRGGKVEVDGILHWMPHRPWFLPLLLLLPRDIPIFCDISMGVKAHNDKIYFISGKNHNLPHVPRILRILAGYVAGAAASIGEPAYKTFMEWYNAGAYQVAHLGETVKDTTYSARTTAAHTIDSATTTVRNTTERVVDRVADVVPAVGTVAEKVGLKTPGTTGMAGMHVPSHTTGTTAATVA